MKRCFALILTLIITATATQTHAAGYALYEWSNRANAMGGAFAAKADDPSAVAYNPAGITQLEGIQTSAGATFITPNSRVRPKTVQGESGHGEDNVWTIPNAYYTHQINDEYWAGFGMYSRVGLGTEYRDMDNWFGRYNCAYAGIKSTSIAAALAYKVTDTFSIAVAPEIILMDFAYTKYTDAGLTNNPGTTEDDIKQVMTAKGWAPGYSIGLRWQPEDWLAFGFTYKGETRLTVHGWADFHRNAGVNGKLQQIINLHPNPAARAKAALINEGANDTDLKGTEPIPASATLGVMIKPHEDLSLEFDLTRTKWSAYRSLTFQYDNALGDQKSRKEWFDTWRYQVGAEYNATDWLDLRLGYVYDETPIPDDHVDYAVPGNDRQMLSSGLGLHFGDLTVDLSYAYLWVTDRNVIARNAEGIQDSTFTNGKTHIMGVNVSWKF